MQLNTYVTKLSSLKKSFIEIKEMNKENLLANITENVCFCLFIIRFELILTQ